MPGESSSEVVLTLCLIFPADDMGLGKTLTMIALILTKKNQEKSKEKDKSFPVTWLSKDGRYKRLLPFPTLFESAGGGFQAMKGHI